jgi:hypothetical protein
MSSDIILGDDDDLTLTGSGGIRLNGPVTVATGVYAKPKPEPPRPSDFTAAGFPVVGPDDTTFHGPPQEDKKTFDGLGYVPGELDLVNEIVTLRKAIRNLNERLRDLNERLKVTEAR